MTNPDRRLTSWKAIAAYLGREVRTVTRWEKERALPIHRGSDDKSGVVFADMDELDAWMRGDKIPTEAVPSVAPAIGTPPRSANRRWIAAAATTAILGIAIGAGAWALRVSRANDGPGIAVLTEDAVIVRTPDGSEKWRYEFTPDRTGPRAAFGPTIVHLGGDGLLVGTSNIWRGDVPAHRSGQLLWFDPAGKIRKVFSFEDHLQIGSRSYASPWVLTGYDVDDNDGTRLIAVSAHHYTWWPSIVTILDDQFKRKGSFVHAGWVEGLRWLPDNRLAIAGFSNLKDGAMVALLDAKAINGQSPVPPGSEFDCAGCGPDRPVRYVVMPRSEVNRVSAAPFNRPSLDIQADTVVISTLELPGLAAPVGAVYEFTIQLDLVHAAYSDRYWQAHRDLERLGKITHTREQCPEREGPSHVEVWEPATGWRVQPVRR